MRILLRPFPGKIYENDQIFKVDNGDNIFFDFDKRLKKYNIKIKTLDKKRHNEKFDLLVFCDVPYFWRFRDWFHLIRNKNKSILFCFESPLVNPFSHRRIFFSFFKSVYTWNDNLIDGKKVFKFNLSVIEKKTRSLRVELKNKKLISLINSNKSIPWVLFLISPFKVDLYKERLKLINYFDKYLSDDFGLYGKGWNQPKKFSVWERILGFSSYKSYKGAIQRNLSSKLIVLSGFKFNVCFENCRAPGYISEKIIDCFKAKTVPVYYGAPNISNYINKNAYIDFEKFSNYEELVDYLRRMPESEYNRYINEGQKILKNNQFKTKWGEEGFMKIFLHALSFEQ